MLDGLKRAHFSSLIETQELMVELETQEPTVDQERRLVEGQQEGMRVKARNADGKGVERKSGKKCRPWRLKKKDSAKPRSCTADQGGGLMLVLSN